MRRLYKLLRDDDAQAVMIFGLFVVTVLLLAT